MLKSIVTAALLGLSVAAWAQGAEQVFELKDGGKVVVQKDGTMAHYDAAGNRIRMRDGVTMTAKDGSKLMMKNTALWRQLTEHATLKPGH
jgi:hypothetical protein